MFSLELFVKSDYSNSGLTITIMKNSIVITKSLLQNSNSNDVIICNSLLPIPAYIYVLA